MPVQGDQISAFNKKLGWIWLGLPRCMISTAYAFVSCSLVEVCDYFFYLQLAVSSVDNGVHGNSDSDSAKHPRCTNEYDLLTGQESRSSGI